MDEFEDKFWREIEVSSNNTIAKLAYIVLAAFESDAYSEDGTLAKCFEYVYEYK